MVRNEKQNKQNYMGFRSLKIGKRFTRQALLNSEACLRFVWHCVNLYFALYYRYLKLTIESSKSE